MAVKLLMTWDILPEHEREYFEFVIQEFIPGIQHLGFQPAEVWATVYGKQPQILVAMLAESVITARQALGTDRWDQLQGRLLEFVQNFDLKVVPARGEFQF